ncbi:hypothetical protein BHM03_00006349 [Ensete ventricosum]|uniref:Uncharacterized protein n=1 Tax=Ensete ventricosum TaxID=4639 RepID=A0A445MBP2_ENSVE|nr:hypothetical protein BHM03_00006349 [Ensete ventricosum]
MQQRRLVPSPHAGTRFFSPHREKKHLLPEKPAQGEETSLRSLDNKPACLAKPMRGEETDVPRFRALVSTPHVRRRNVIFFSPCGEKKCHFLLPAITEAYSPRRFFSPRSLSDIPRLRTLVSSLHVGRRNVVFFSPRSPKHTHPAEPRLGFFSQQAMERDC